MGVHRIDERNGEIKNQKNEQKKLWKVMTEKNEEIKKNFEKTCNNFSKSRGVIYTIFEEKLENIEVLQFFYISRVREERWFKNIWRNWKKKQKYEVIMTIL